MAAAELNIVEFMLELNKVDVLLVELATAPIGIVVKYRLTAVFVPRTFDVARSFVATAVVPAKEVRNWPNASLGVCTAQ